MKNKNYCQIILLILLFLLIIANLILLDIYLVKYLKSANQGIYRTLISPDGKIPGTLLNSSEISARETCNIALMSLNFEDYSLPCCFDLGAQSVFVRNSCYARHIFDNPSFNSLWVKEWNTCKWEGITCENNEITQL